MLTIKPLVGSLILSGLLLLGHYVQYQRLSNAKEVIHRLTDWQDEVVKSVRLASGNQKVTQKTALVQIQSMGHLQIQLKAQIKTNNEKIDALEAKRLAALAAASQARKEKALEIAKVELLSDQLRHEQDSAAPLEDQIRDLQDKLYEVGL